MLLLIYLHIHILGSTRYNKWIFKNRRPLNATIAFNKSFNFICLQKNMTTHVWSSSLASEVSSQFNFSFPVVAQSTYIKWLGCSILVCNKIGNLLTFWLSPHSTTFAMILSCFLWSIEWAHYSDFEDLEP